MSRLQHPDWDERVKNTINEFLNRYGKDSPLYSKDSYAVFDFDNTTSIFDSEDILGYYQITRMAYCIRPDEFKKVFLADIPHPEWDISEFGYCHGTYEDLVDDIAAAYTVLWREYGGFSADGLSDEQADRIAENPNWQEFAAKMMVLFTIVYASATPSLEHSMSPAQADMWMYCRFFGMTSDEVYKLGMRCNAAMSVRETEELTFKSPVDIRSSVGPVSCDWACGLSVSDNIIELYRVLSENGIDVWISSASNVDDVRAAVDYFGLSSYCKGIVGMTPNKDENGRYTYGYAMEDGHGYYCNGGGAWEVIDLGQSAVTWGTGKIDSINNSIAPMYNRSGPVFGCMDSGGDFNFCTEYESMKLVLCINRATRKVTEGGSLIEEVAIYQADKLNYSLSDAEKNNDTLYLLQGREENGMRGLVPDRKTHLFGDKDLQLLANKNNFSRMDYFAEKQMSVKEIFDTFAIFKKAGDGEFPFDSGFLENYGGYRSR